MECSQSNESGASPLGLLFACLPQAMWGAYSQDPYPADPVDSGLIGNIPDNATPNKAANFNRQWDFVKKVHTDFGTTNSALITLVIQTGLFGMQYEQWHERTDG